MFQSIILVNTNNPVNQPEPEVAGLNKGTEESKKEKTFDPEGKDYFDIEKIFDNLIHGKLF